MALLVPLYPSDMTASLNLHTAVFNVTLDRNDTVQNVELDAGSNRSLHMEVPYVEWADNLKSNFREGIKKVSYEDSSKLFRDISEV